MEKYWTLWYERELSSLNFTITYIFKQVLVNQPSCGQLPKTFARVAAAAHNESMQHVQSIEGEGFYSVS